MAEQTRRLEVSFPGGMRVDVASKGFVIKTDQPLDEGGESSAPAPFDLFLGSIGACAGYYLLAFCKGREIPLDKAGVVMTTAKDPVNKMIGEITIELLLPVGFPEKYADAAVRAVDACTVKRHIVKAPAFKIITTFQS
jgi:putative redox protein